MKAYLINLDRSPDRLLRMKAEFAKANINFERVTAVEGKLISDAEVAGIKTNPGWKQPLNRTENRVFSQPSQVFGTDCAGHRQVCRGF